MAKPPPPKRVARRPKSAELSAPMLDLGPEVHMWSRLRAKGSWREVVAECGVRGEPYGAQPPELPMSGVRTTGWPEQVTCAECQKKIAESRQKS